MILSYQDVKTYLRNAGFKGINLEAAIKICFCESSFDTNAHNTAGEDSRGLMQINLDAHPYLSHLNLFDPVINTVEAYKIYSQTGNFAAWSCARQLGLTNPELIIFGTALAFVIGIVLYYS